ncbi:hypothetical protein BYT27DRAFT_6397811 [Phlegmacium glaucopus]|nr:hypothetical protein BYT27DRAFT_6397811 [Phlegmacium glaucopus]
MSTSYLIYHKIEDQPHLVILIFRVAFCVLHEKEDGTLMPGDFRKQLYRGYATVFDEYEGYQSFEEKLYKIPHESNHIGIVNMTESIQRFALCTIDPTRPEADNLSPVIDLIQLYNDSDTSKGFHCGPPIILQAYNISSYKERQPIDITKLQRPLFVNADLKPRAIDMRSLGETTRFRLYSINNGRTVLERA